MGSMQMRKAALILSIIAAFITLYAAVGVEIRDSLDTITADNATKSKWVALAAGTSLLSAALQFASLLRGPT